MANASFTLEGTNDDSSTVLIGTGEVGRVRFSSFPHNATVTLGIIRNSVTTYAPISSPYEHSDAEINNRAVFMDCGMPGDTLFVRATTVDAPVTGILEGVTFP